MNKIPSTNIVPVPHTGTTLKKAIRLSSYAEKERVFENVPCKVVFVSFNCTSLIMQMEHNTVKALQQAQFCGDERQSVMRLH